MTDEVNRRVFLRVKASSLAEEARIIRRAAKKQRGRTKWELNHHRTTVIRPIARATHLALGFLRGRKYEQMEHKCRTEPNWDEVDRLIRKYGPPNTNLEYFKSAVERDTAATDPSAV